MGFFVSCVRPQLVTVAAFSAPLLFGLLVMLCAPVGSLETADQMSMGFSMGFAVWAVVALFLLPVWCYFRALRPFSLSPVWRFVGALVLSWANFWLFGFVVEQIGGQRLVDWFRHQSTADFGPDEGYRLVLMVLGAIGYVVLYCGVGPSLVACVGRSLRLHREASGLPEAHREV
jgi:hypothetical protein